MEHSIELETFYLQICEALSKGDSLFFERHFSQEDGVLAIGTDPTEWWDNYESITRVFKAQLQEADGFQVLANVCKAYCDGKVGWLAGRPTLILPGGAEISIRLTAVLQKQKTDWKIVQWHFSTGVTNDDLIGLTLTT